MSLKLKDLVPYFQAPAPEPLRVKMYEAWENPWEWEEKPQSDRCKEDETDLPL